MRIPAVARWVHGAARRCKGGAVPTRSEWGLRRCSPQRGGTQGAATLALAEPLGRPRPTGGRLGGGVGAGMTGWCRDHGEFVDRHRDPGRDRAHRRRGGPGAAFASADQPARVRRAGGRPRRHRPAPARGELQHRSRDRLLLGRGDRLAARTAGHPHPAPGRARSERAQPSERAGRLGHSGGAHRAPARAGRPGGSTAPPRGPATPADRAAPVAPPRDPATPADRAAPPRPRATRPGPRRRRRPPPPRPRATRLRPHPRIGHVSAHRTPARPGQDRATGLGGADRTPPR